VNRALTIMELLLALALLSVLTVALRASADTAAALAWESAALATLDLVSDDLSTGDVALQGPAASARVEVTPRGLRIRFRETASAPECLVHAYRVDADTRSLYRYDVRGTDRAEQPRSGRLLLGDVRAFEPTIDPDSRTLTITLTSVAGRTQTRTCSIR
jgi:hypothetical protein